MKYVLILGGKSDIGKAIAKQFASLGFGIYLGARKCDTLQKDCTDLEIRYNVQAKPVEFDALKTDSHKSFFENLDPKPFCTVSVIGYLGDQKKGQNNFAETKKIIDTNFTALTSILNIVANYYEQENKGSIIGVSSVAGDRGRKSNYLYGSAKAGFTAYLSGLRNRLSSHNIQVLTVKPGFVNTKMTENMDLPEKLTAEPEEVGKAVVKGFLKKRNVIYTKGIWKLIMLVIIHIPEMVFKRLSL
jgi:short-subunit dehydrogenase